MDSFLLTKDIAQLSRFISDELAPTEEYNKILGQALDELASYLKERVPTLCVKEVFKVGVSKGGAILHVIMLLMSGKYKYILSWDA
jgi:hypothetical protein